MQLSVTLIALMATASVQIYACAMLDMEELDVNINFLEH